ncbi:MAG: hypothetical protein V3S16_15290 [Candidatus Desulfatibia sp.]|uniref:hypothetical protein n=1 Tax=Candidatus Desulfatibia sp. TaxID=3101189 RepID=UPI002F2EAB99
MVILNVKPNTCGMLVGGLDRLPEISELVHKIEEIKDRKDQIDGIDIQWDFHISNHFIDLFWVKPLGEVQLSEYVFIIHSSARELAGDNRTGFGLYYDRSQRLADMAEMLDTPFGPLYILTGSRAREYYEFNCYAEEFSKQKRILAAEALFGEFQYISNEVHQRLVNMNEILLGCHLLPEKDPEVILPLVLRADRSPAFGDFHEYAMERNQQIGSASINYFRLTIKNSAKINLNFRVVPTLDSCNQVSTH